jgi:hypothetical protein
MLLAGVGVVLRERNEEKENVVSDLDKFELRGRKLLKGKLSVTDRRKIKKLMARRRVLMAEGDALRAALRRTRDERVELLSQGFIAMAGYIELILKAMIAAGMTVGGGKIPSRMRPR